MGVDLQTDSPPENAANNVPDDRKPPAIAPTEGRDREQPSVEAAPEEVQVEASAKEAEPMPVMYRGITAEKLPAASDIALVAQVELGVGHCGAHRSSGKG